MMAMLLLTAVVGCIQKVPPDVVEAIDALDRQLIESQGAEYAPDAYARFIKHWVALRGRLQAEEDEIVWPWKRTRYSPRFSKYVPKGKKPSLNLRNGVKRGV